MPSGRCCGPGDGGDGVYDLYELFLAQELLVDGAFSAAIDFAGDEDTYQITVFSSGGISFACDTWTTMVLATTQ